MANSREELHEVLCRILGSRYVYFQPPESLKLHYPCIVYSLSKVNTTFANNNPYLHRKRYSVTVIDEDPDSAIPDAIGALPMCTFDRPYASDNLNHYVYDLYF